jgi:predicted nucleic acid-binding protein
MSVLVDTNILIDLLNGRPEARAYLRKAGKIDISTITHHEVLAGCTGTRAKQLSVAEMLLGACNVIPVSAEISALAARYQRKRNTKRKMADFLIEATAKEHGLKLATRNPQDFKNAQTILPYKI